MVVVNVFHKKLLPSFNIVINAAIFVVKGSLLHCNAWILIIVVAFITIPDFHHVDMHFGKNFFMF